MEGIKECKERLGMERKVEREGRRSKKWRRVERKESKERGKEVKE